MSDEYAFMVATYVDLAAADADYSAVQQLFSGFDPPIAFDAVTLGRKASGETRLGQRPPGDRSPDGPRWSLAEGLAAALFPSVGADAPATQLAAREIHSAVAGEVSRHRGRDARRDLGAHLDGAAAALVVAAAPAHKDRVGAALTRARSVMTRTAPVDVFQIDRTSRSAQHIASPRSG
jgi:hypothetical protein